MIAWGSVYSIMKFTKYITCLHFYTSYIHVCVSFVPYIDYNNIHVHVNNIWQIVSLKIVWRYIILILMAWFLVKNYVSTKQIKGLNHHHFQFWIMYLSYPHHLSLQQYLSFSCLLQWLDPSKIIIRCKNAKDTIISSIN